MLKTLLVTLFLGFTGKLIAHEKRFFCDCSCKSKYNSVVCNEDVYTYDKDLQRILVETLDSRRYKFSSGRRAIESVRTMLRKCRKDILENQPACHSIDKRI